MAIDNFQQVRDSLLRFDCEGEFYLVLVLRRRKDVAGKVAEGVNEDNRLIKHYFVYDAEYLDRKRDSIVALCEKNNARAYILPQRRSHDIVLWALHEKTGAVLKSGAKNTHFDHLIRSCVAGCHETPPGCRHYKRWVIDIDADDAESLRCVAAWRGIPPAEAAGDVPCYADWLATGLRRALAPDYACFRSEMETAFMPTVNPNYRAQDVALLPTPHGFHIVTPPFNRDEKAMQAYFGVGCPSKGMVKPDAMALLFAPETIETFLAKIPEKVLAHYKGGAQA